MRNSRLRGAGCRIFSLSLVLLLVLQSVAFGFADVRYSSFVIPFDGKNAFVPSACPGAGLLISEVFVNPPGNDSPFEFVELRATRTINFSTTPYSVVVNNNGTATAAGWVAGGALSYGFNITTGTVNAGDVVYVGGSSMTPTGVKLRAIDTGTTAGDGFGTASSAGVFGNGGGNADGVAVFDVAIGSVTNSTVPIDAIFYGTGTGTAVVAGGAAGYQLPVNDNYSGGKLQTTSFIAVDPGANYLTATGAFNTATCSFATNRTWAASATLTDGTSSVALVTPGAPTISASSPGTFLSVPATGGGAVSGVAGDTTDPMTTTGLNFTINDPDTPIASLVVTATSGNTAVLPQANLNLTGSGSTRNLKITAPTAAGYSNVTVTVSDGALTSNYVVNYAVSTPTGAGPTTRFHTGKSDASTAIAIDANNMLIADDEDQVLRIYSRQNSGLPSNGFDQTPNLGLTDFSGGIPREVDIEASAQVGNRIYWLGSHSNSATGANRPNRTRLFATDISGVGAGSTLTYVGRYDNLKTDLINWDVTNGHGLGANFFGLASSAAVGTIPEAADGSGFNIEGLVFAPDNTTGYISFRAPIVPASARTKALIVPVTNMAALVTGNPSAGPATFGAPIQLNLGGRGIREIKKNASNEYLIVAGDAGILGNFATYSWTGNPLDPALPRSSNLASLNPEAIVDIPVGLNAFSPLAAVNVTLVSDNGDDVYYGDGVLAKDLPNVAFKKFRSDTVTVQAFVPTAANVGISGRVGQSNGVGIRGAIVTAMNAATGETVSARTNSFGRFQIGGLPAGATYVVQVRFRDLSFGPRVMTLDEEALDVDFIAN